MDKREFLGSIYKSLGDIKESVVNVSNEYAADYEINYKLHVIELAITAVQDMLDTRAQTLRREGEKDAE